MASIESRVAKLEQSSGARRLPLEGWLTVDLRPAIREVTFRLYGFDIEEIDAPPFVLPRKADVSKPFTLREMLAASKPRRDLMQRLVPLDREARAKLAAEHGFTVVYPESR